MLEESSRNKTDILRRWIEDQYCGRKIKISGEPYFTHLLFVAEMAAEAVPLGYEIGLCHDLLEDVKMPSDELHDTLLKFNYTNDQATYITATVVELTDTFTREAYPNMPKKERKKQEAKRLLKISSAAQTVKYCDMIYNIGWVLKFEPQKAKQYLEKKKELIEGLTAGDRHLHRMVADNISMAITNLQVFAPTLFLPKPGEV